MKRKWLLKNWIDDLKFFFLVFDCEQFSCYPTGNTWHQDIKRFYSKSSSSYQFSRCILGGPMPLSLNWKKNNVILHNRCPNYLHLLIWSMQTYTLKLDGHWNVHTTRRSSFISTGPICFEFVLFSRKTRKHSGFPVAHLKELWLRF